MQLGGQLPVSGGLAQGLVRLRRYDHPFHKSLFRSEEQVVARHRPHECRVLVPVLVNGDAEEFRRRFGLAESVLKSFRTQMPTPYQIADRDVQINGILVTVDSNSKKAEHIERICLKAEFDDNATYDSDDGKPDHFNNEF